MIVFRRNMGVFRRVDFFYVLATVFFNTSGDEVVEFYRKISEEFGVVVMC